MRRRDLIAMLGGAAVAWPHAAAAQTGRIYRIGILETVPQAGNAANLAALLRGLAEHGFVEGQNLRIEYRSAEGRAVLFPELAAELVRLRVDLIVTRGTPAARAAKDATSTIPIVMAAIGEPLGVGVVATLARPGGNITGLSAFVTVLAGKRIEVLKEIVPSIVRVAFMANMGNPVAPPQWEATQTVARALGLAVELLDVRNQDDLTRAFNKLAASKVDALSLGIDALIQARADAILDLAAMHRLPAIYPSREFAAAGGLSSYGPRYPDLYFRAAGMIDKIFKGAKPGDLPVEQPTKLELVVNLKTAKALGLTIPPTLLARADEVIE